MRAMAAAPKGKHTSFRILLPGAAFHMSSCSPAAARACCLVTGVPASGGCQRASGQGLLTLLNLNAPAQRLWCTACACKHKAHKHDGVSPGEAAITGHSACGALLFRTLMMTACSQSEKGSLLTSGLSWLCHLQAAAEH
jgi:hypothetical protein